VPDHDDVLAGLLDGHVARSADEAADLARLGAAVARGGAAGVWGRSGPLHVTGSAVVVDPVARRVLLRWHDRMQSWLQVGGHTEDDDADALVTALREAEEETGLPDLTPWPDAAHPVPVHVVIVPVPAGGDEPAHEHADVRYVVATARPDAAVPEHETAPLRWLTIAEALELVAEDNLRTTLDRVAALLDAR
jgi:8-oxo-dGTP pyrophosphatase MutT (NUDIX family)